MMGACEYQKEIHEIIVNSDARLLVETAHNIARTMVRKKDQESVSTSQIRNIFGASKKIEMSLDDENVHEMYGRLLLLKPKMAYANGRFNKPKSKKQGGGDSIPGFRVLVDCLSHAIDKVDGDQGRMNNFFSFFEAILAYHRAEGGKLS